MPRLLRALSALDWLVLATTVYLAARAFAAPDGLDATIARRMYGCALAALLVAFWVVRGERIGPGFGRSMAYRLTLLGVILGPYLLQRRLLFALQPVLLDAELAHLDRALFGEVPAVLLAPHVGPGAVEWFALVYGTYYLLLAAIVVPVVLMGAGPDARRFLSGVVVVYGLGQVGYTLVPGYGPYRALSFATPLEGGPILASVYAFVVDVGPLLDIFPSLHTAFPCFIALTAWRLRRRRRLARWLWLPGVVLALNIVAATQVLRWHYAVDVFAGLLLVAVAWVIGTLAEAWEARRMAAGGAPALEPLPHLWQPRQ